MATNEKNILNDGQPQTDAIKTCDDKNNSVRSLNIQEFQIYSKR